MKLFKLALLVFATAFIFKQAISQNALINVLTQNTGVVHIGGTVFFEVTVNNTDPTNFIGVYKIKVQVSVPSIIVSIASTGHILPTGWTITSNDGFVINLSNGKDMIAANDARTILIAVKGNKIGGPSTLSGQLFFADGIQPGTDPGILTGDNPADNFSTSTCKVIR